MMLTSPLQPATRIGRGEFLGTEISGHLVLMNASKGNYVKLDEIGGAIWQRLEPPTTIAQLCDDLARLYDADRAELARDVVTFLESLRIQGLVEVLQDVTTP
jgi:hypothetical protein